MSLYMPDNEEDYSLGSCLGVYLVELLNELVFLKLLGDLLLLFC